MHVLFSKLLVVLFLRIISQFKCVMTFLNPSGEFWSLDKTNQCDFMFCVQECDLKPICFPEKRDDRLAGRARA